LDTYLITGGTGSFGNAVVRHLLASTRSLEVRILSRDEAKQDAMRLALADDRVRFFLGDVRDRGSVDRAMRGVHYVFHAAALKQVPTCEFFPEQAVMTNVLGSQNVLDAAEAAQVTRVVCISTDKAVYPVNAMGMSKAIMEKLVQAKARAIGKGGTVVATVRYGNVLNSRGSVVPVFVDQIRRGRPLTITAPEMTRFLLTLSDAIHLIEFALRNASQGDTFIRKSAAATVIDMAEAVRELYGADLPIERIGVRHGEKIHETLCTFAETAAAEDMGEYLRIRLDSRGDLPQAYLSEGDPKKLGAVDYTSDRTERLDVEQVKALLRTVPEIAADVGVFQRERAT
jgi:UDP-glucose 4-epimerase